MELLDIHRFFPHGSSAYLIAINTYQPPVPALHNAVNDVTEIAKVLKEQHGFKVTPLEFSDNGHTVTLPNPLINPTSAQVIQFLSSIDTKEHERVIIYFAGHGIAIDSEGNPQGFLMAADATAGKWESFISMDQVRTLIDRFSCKHLLVVLDCCYAGAFRWGRNTRGPGADIPKTIYYERFKQYTTNKAWQVLTSSAHDQKAIDSLTPGMRVGNRGGDTALSPFAKLFIDGIGGKADLTYGTVEADGVITISEMSYFLQTEIFKTLHHAGVEADERQLPLLFPIIDVKKNLFGKGEFVFLDPSKNNVALKRREDINPYKGLFAYSEHDASIFYGRQRVLDGWYDQSNWNPGLIELSKQYNTIIITGHSGSGKSSLAKAGILSYYKKEGRQVHPTIRPGKTPYTSNKELLDRLYLLGNQVLLIDQYEELVTICTSETEKQQFEKAVRDASVINLVIITIRSDFENQFKQSPVLQIQSREDHKTKHRFVVPPFLRDEIREIIVQPAVQQLLEFKAVRNVAGADEQFVNGMIDEAFQNTGSLPLLSLALSELYQKKEENRLLESEYKKFGGITGILDEKASNEYKQLHDDPHAQGLFRQLIFRMISFDSGLRSKKRVYTDVENETEIPGVSDELNQPGDDTPKIKEIANALIRARLVTADVDEHGKPFIEPSHDALLRSWGLLSDWLKEKDKPSGLDGQEIVQLLKSVTDSTANYNKGNEKEKSGYINSWASHPRLLSVKNFISDYLNKEEQHFIGKAYRRKTRNRNLRNVAIVLIVAAAAWGWIQQSAAAREANKNRALYLASVSDKYGPTEQLSILKEAYSISADSTIKQKIDGLFQQYNTYNPFAVAYFESKEPFDAAVFSGEAGFNTSFAAEEIQALTLDSVKLPTHDDTFVLRLLAYSKSVMSYTPPQGFKMEDSTVNSTDSTMNVVYEDEADSGKYIFAHFDKFKKLRTKIEFDKPEVEKITLINETSFFSVHTEDSVKLYDETGKIWKKYLYSAYDDIDNVIRVNDSCYTLFKDVIRDNYVIHSLADDRKIVVEYKDRNLTNVQSLKYNNDTIIINFVSDGYDNLGYGFWSNLYTVNLKTGVYTDIQYNGFPSNIRLSPSKRKLFAISSDSIQVIRFNEDSAVKRFGFTRISGINFPGNSDIYTVIWRSSHGFTTSVYDEQDRNLNNLEYSVAPGSIFLSTDKKYLGAVFNNRKILIWQIDSYAGIVPDDGKQLGLSQNFLLENFVSNSSGNMIIGDFGSNFQGCIACAASVTYINSKPLEFAGLNAEVLIPFPDRDSVIVLCPGSTEEIKTYCIADVRRYPAQMQITPESETVLLKELSGGKLDFRNRNGNIYIRTNNNKEYLVDSANHIFSNWPGSYYIDDGKLFKDGYDTITIYSDNSPPGYFIGNIPQDDFDRNFPMNKFSEYYKFLKLTKQKQYDRLIKDVVEKAKMDSTDIESVLDFVRYKGRITFYRNNLVVTTGNDLIIFDLDKQRLEETLNMPDFSDAFLVKNGREVIAMRSDGSFFYRKTKKFLEDFIQNGYTIPITSVLRL